MAAATAHFATCFRTASSKQIQFCIFRRELTTVAKKIRCKHIRESFMFFKIYNTAAPYYFLS